LTFSRIDTLPSV